jgi:hypothetical protein
MEVSTLKGELHTYTQPTPVHRMKEGRGRSISTKSNPITTTITIIIFVVILGPRRFSFDMEPEHVATPIHENQSSPTNSGFFRRPG